MSQAVQGGDVLFLFQRYFGGTVRLKRPEAGTQAALLHWIVSGEKSRRAAEMLGRARLGKQRQLLAFARGLPTGPEERAAVLEQMRMWKKTPETAQFQNMSEVAGFFDAEGCIMASSQNFVQLKITHKHKVQLEALQQFIREELKVETAVSFDTTGLCFVFSVRARQPVEKILESMLAGGLLLKKAQAELVLTCDKEDRQGDFVRQQLREMNGWQHKFNRQNPEGDARSRAIRSLQNQRSQLQRTSKVAKDDSSSRAEAKKQRIMLLEAEIAKLKHEHNREELIRQIQDMQSRLAASLQTGRETNSA